MQARGERLTALTGVLAVILWIVGLVVINSFSDKIPHHPTDAQLLAWVKGNSNSILLGGWLFMVGCVSFLWFANVVRTRLAAAEGGSSHYSTLCFAGGIGGAVFGMLINAGDVGAAVDKGSISAATAGVLHNGTDVFFVAAELMMIPFVLGAAIVFLKTRMVPRFWAWFSILVAIVLLIGPIGWAGLIFGTPIWILGTTFFLLRPERQSQARPAPALA